MNIVVFDTETTGLIEPDLIEFGCVYMNESTEVMINKKILSKPDKPIMPSATAVHGISPDVADKYPSSDISIPEIYEFLTSFDDEDTVFMAHNISYDMNVLNAAFKKHLDKEFNPRYTIDTLKLSKKIIPMNEIGGYSVDAVFYYLYPNKLPALMESRSIHDAISDSNLTMMVYDGLYERCAATSTMGMISFANDPTDLSESPWMFGKHKDTLIKDTPDGYIRWCLNSDFGADKRNSDIVFTLKKIQQERASRHVR